jgi:hypothetical protein
MKRLVLFVVALVFAFSTTVMAADKPATAAPAEKAVAAEPAKAEKAEKKETKKAKKTKKTKKEKKADEPKADAPAAAPAK